MKVASKTQHLALTIFKGFITYKNKKTEQVYHSDNERNAFIRFNKIFFIIYKKTTRKKN